MSRSLAGNCGKEAQREIARRNLNGNTGAGHGNRYPLSGKIQCSVCGKSFVSRTSEAERREQI